MDNLNDPVTLSLEAEAKNLLTINQLNMIITFMDDYMRVVYIFQHLCNISLHDLFTFLSVLTESDNNKHIGDILTKGMYICSYTRQIR